MSLVKFPEDLSGESSKVLRGIVMVLERELEERGGFEGVVYTFKQKKEGKLLNHQHKWVGDKVANLYEFVGPDKKVKEFVISSTCKGSKEPVEDKESVYGDQHKYRLAFEDEDERTIVGCYRE